MQNVSSGRDYTAIFFTILKYLFILLPAAVYFGVVGKYAVNIPSQDDYDAILKFLIKYEGAHNGIEKIQLLHSQHNEHRILSSRLIYVLYNSIFGSINFRSIIFIGNLQLVLLLLILVAFIKKALPRYWVIAGFITSLCLFDINNWENADFAMAAMQNYGIILLCAAGIYFYSLNNKKWLPVAAVLQVLCIYSSGSGIIAAGIMMLTTMLLKDKLKIIFTAGILLISAPLYFVHFQSPAPHHSIGFGNTILFFFHQAGAHISFPDLAPSVITGVVIFVLFLIVFPVKKLFTNTIPLICLSLFAWASVSTITIFRSTAGSSYCNRYLVYPHLIYALTFIFILIKLSERNFIKPLIFFCVLFSLIIYNMNFYYGLHGFESLNKTLTTKLLYYPDTTGAKIITDKACELNIYCRTTAL